MFNVGDVVTSKASGITGKIIQTEDDRSLIELDKPIHHLLKCWFHNSMLVSDEPVTEETWDVG